MMDDTVLEEALNAYFEHFGKSYPLNIVLYNGTDEEIVARVKECIESNTPAPEPVYDPECDY